MTPIYFETPVLQPIEGRVHPQLPGLVEDIGLYDALRLRWDACPRSKFHTEYFASTRVAALTCRVAVLWTLNDK